MRLAAPASQSPAARRLEGFVERSGAELLIEAPDLGPDRVLRSELPLSDLPARESLPESIEHFELPRGQGGPGAVLFDDR